jgi:hypothetical protein
MVNADLLFAKRYLQEKENEKPKVRNRNGIRHKGNDLDMT